MTQRPGGLTREAFPVRGMPRTANDIAFPRAKPRWVALAVGYRVMRVGQRLLGTRRLLRLGLDATWILWRLSYELSMGLFGPAFPNTTYGVSEELLGRLIPPGGSVVDIGCGGGRLCQMAARFAARVVGIDYDGARLAGVIRDNVTPNIEFRVGDVTTSLPHERFDLALLVGVLEHVDDVDALLQSIGKVSGTLVVEVPDFEADCLNLVRRDVGCAWYTDADHVREYTQPLLQADLERNGWRPVEWTQRGGMLLAVSVFQS